MNLISLESSFKIINKFFSLSDFILLNIKKYLTYLVWTMAVLRSRKEKETNTKDTWIARLDQN